MPYIGQSLTEGTRREYTYVATASQTTFNAIYTVGAVDVYQNGVLLAPSDYTATTGTTVVFNTGAALNDEITIHCHNTFSVADTVSASQGGTFNGPVVADSTVTVNDDVTINGDLTVDTTTLVVDSTNNRVAIGTPSPQTNLHVQSTGDTGIQITKEGSVAARLFTPSGALAVGVDTANGTTERLRFDTSGNVICGSDGGGDIGSPSKRFKHLFLSGKITYFADASGGEGGLNVQSRYTYNDGNNNFVGTLNSGFTVLVINQGSGSIVLPFFQNAGGGVAWSGSLFDPDAGSFVYGNGPIVTFTAAGTNANTYRVQMVGGSGYTYVQRTAGSQAYTATICALLY